jgi:hypothetical protein
MKELKCKMDTNGRAMDTDRRWSPGEFPIDPPRLHAVSRSAKSS